MIIVCFKELRTWDLTQVACIRRIDLNFTSDLNSKKNARMELGQNPLVFIKSKGKNNFFNYDFNCLFFNIFLSKAYYILLAEIRLQR